MGQNILFSLIVNAFLMKTLSGKICLSGHGKVNGSAEWLRTKIFNCKLFVIKIKKCLFEDK